MTGVAVACSWSGVDVCALESDENGPEKVTTSTTMIHDNFAFKPLILVLLLY